MPAGATGYLTVTLEPGRYVWLAEVPGPDRKGMHRTFVVPETNSWEHPAGAAGKQPMAFDLPFKREIMRECIRILALLLTTGTVAGCSRPPINPATGDAIVTEETAGLLRQAAIGPDSATRLAKATVPGRITKAELEREDGVLLYSFDIEVAGESGITEVHVDAATGAIISNEKE